MSKTHDMSSRYQDDIVVFSCYITLVLGIIIYIRSRWLKINKKINKTNMFQQNP